MNKLVSAIAILGTMALLQACVVGVGVGYGYGHGWGHGGYGHGHGGWHHLSAELQDMPVASTTSTDSAALLSQDYSIKYASAQKIIALASGKNMNQSLLNLNLTEKDLAPMQDYNMPSDEAIAKISASLGEPKETVEQILTDFLADASAED